MKFMRAQRTDLDLQLRLHTAVVELEVLTIVLSLLPTVYLTGRKLAHCARAAHVRGIS